MPGARVRLHVTGQMLQDGPARMPGFYRELMAGLAGLGAETELLRRLPDDQASASDDGSFDFVHAGRIERPRLLNLGVAYLSGHYYVDAKGVNFESAITDKVFRPAMVPPDKARAFFDQLQAKLVVPRKSRLNQARDSHDFGTGHLAIFLQDWSKPVERAQLIDSHTMVRLAVEHGGGRPVVIKPHPRYSGRETKKIKQFVRHLPHVRMTDANVHDILRGAAATLSISSSLALEGMLHRVPAILFGRSDLHHCATTLTRPDDWPAALERALTTDWPYERFLLWFLRWQNLDTSRPFLPRVLERMAAQGADFAALGITVPQQAP